MTTYVRIACPYCPRTLKVRSEYLNQWIVCNHCEHRFEAREAGESKSTSDPVPSPAEIEVLRKDLESSRAESNRLLVLIEDLRTRAEVADRNADELRSTRAENDRLSFTVRMVESELAARTAEVDRLTPVSQQLAATRAERDRIAAEHSAASEVIGRLEAVLTELARQSKEKEARHEAQLADQHREFKQASAGWAAERVEIEAESLKQREALASEAEARLEYERAALSAERVRWQKELEAASLRFNHERSVLRSDLQRHLDELSALQAQHEALASQFTQEKEARHAEADGLRTELVAEQARRELSENLADFHRQELADLEAVCHEAEARHRSDTSALTSQLSEAHCERDRSQQQAHVLSERTEAIEAELDHQRQQFETERSRHREALEIVRSDLEAALRSGTESERERFAIVETLRAETEELRSRLEASMSEQEDAITLADALQRDRDNLSVQLSEREAALRVAEERHRFDSESFIAESEELRLEMKRLREEIEAERIDHLKAVELLRIDLEAAAKSFLPDQSSPRAPIESGSEALAVGEDETRGLADALDGFEAWQTPVVSEPEPGPEESDLEPTRSTNPARNEPGAEIAALAPAIDHQDVPEESLEARFHALRHHLREVHDAEARNRRDRRLFSRLSRLWRHDGSVR